MITSDQETVRKVFRPGGLFVVLDGIDGCGKTTQVQLLADHLIAANYECVATREPTSGPWGHKLRYSALHGRLPPVEELEVILQDRRYDVEICINPALSKGSVVIADRYYTSTLTYQVLRGFDAEYLLQRNHEFAPAPHLIFLLYLDLDVALSRIRLRGGAPDKFEDAEQLRQIAEHFDTIQLPGLVRIDGALSQQAIHNEIFDTIMNART